MSAAEPLDSLDERIREHLEEKDNHGAAELACSHHGAEILGWLCAVLLDNESAKTTYDAFKAELATELWTFRGEYPVRISMYSLARKLAMKNVRPPSRVDSPIGASVGPTRSQEDGQARTPQDLNASALVRMREVLEPEERMILVLRVDRGMSWEDVARVMENPPTQATLRECATRLRRYFQRTKERLRELAARQGLLPDPSTTT
ncbi:MAG TPA: hypothetical protein VK420_21370 [Longimicrobium sp.]|nr:hypothetical protein [Longimicrobium sp.]